MQVFANNWRDEEIAVRRTLSGETVLEQDLVDRVYTSQLIGLVPDLVMHGGGNTSCKSKATDLFGVEIDVLCVKGSGWDLGTIEAAGLPALKLFPLLELRELDSLSDEDMVNFLRANLLDSSSPNPSVETLLHAFLPQKFIDHTHSTPFLSLANLPHAGAVLEEIFGNKLKMVPYVMPGFDLAKIAAGIFDQDPDIEGLLLEKHGHFTWGQSAKESYLKVIEHTNLVEDWLNQHRKGPKVQVARSGIRLGEREVNGFLQNLRGGLMTALSENTTPSVLHLISSDAVVNFLDRDDIEVLSKAGVATPDHVIRTKPHPLLLRRADIKKGKPQIVKCIKAYIKDYEKYFARHSTLSLVPKKMLSPLPNLIWAQGVGLIGVASSANATKVITDLAKQNIKVMADGVDAGGFHPVKAQDLFDLEYWSLEQAKLGRSSMRPLQGRVVVVTGGGGAIGRAIAQKFLGVGAEILLVDNRTDSLCSAREFLKKDVETLAVDVTGMGAGERIVDHATAKFGGVDILVSNAGAAYQGSIIGMSQKSLRESFELNFFAHFDLAQAFGKAMKNQGFGGQILFNVSKQAVNPGENFGAYGLPKAALFFLVRQLALEFGGEGIRVNGINADRIRSGLLTDDLIEERAKARGVNVANYLSGNLLRKEVEASHVADAFVALALSNRTTGHVMTVDGGNIEASLR
jgi:rhamnose utilization protein RhaD (predicted bifunctional aldolase and dehydrogenase)/NAD(P)-dependent dehydrogenase (short-subunit alcohol dehydrogenase family)